MGETHILSLSVAACGLSQKPVEMVSGRLVSATIRNRFDDVQRHPRRLLDLLHDLFELSGQPFRFLSSDLLPGVVGADRKEDCGRLSPRDP